MALLALALLVQQADACTSHWSGAIDLPSAKLAFTADFTKTSNGSCRGTISIPQQNAKDVLLSNVDMRIDSVHFTIVGVPGSPTFSGARAADSRSARGTFTQGPASFPFDMTLAATAAEVAAKALEGFDAWVDSARVMWKVVGLSVGITVDGQTVYLKGHGERDQERHLPVTPQTLFAIGSSSKAFTTFAMGALVDQGKLRWDVPLRSYLPWFRMQDADKTLRLTPRDLVTHRSGLPRHDLVWYNNSTATREELVRALAYLPANKDLRETFQYNNLMFLTAGYLVGSINNTSWEDGLRQLVLNPLGMARTNFSVKQVAADPDHSIGYQLRHDSIIAMPYRDISLVGPAGSINSSAEDMLKWVGLHVAGGKLGEKQVIQTATLRDMYKPYMPISGLTEYSELGPMSYGMGWFVDTYRGHYRAQHGGNIDGFTASVTVLPQDRIGIVVLLNQNAAALGELVARHAMDRLFGGTRRDWSGQSLAQFKIGQRTGADGEKKKGEARIPNAPPSHKLADYVGTYADSGYGPIAVTLDRDTLSVDYHGLRAKLQPWHFETFSGLRNPADPTFENMPFSFRTNAAGHVDALLATLDANVPPIVFARQADPRLRDASYLQRFAGKYQILGAGVITVSLKGNALFLSQGPGAESELEPEDGTRFVLKAMRVVTIEFTVDVAGKVIAARVTQPGAVTDAMRIP